MRPKFTFSEEVRVVRAIRNDGTVAGFAPGALLVRRGSTVNEMTDAASPSRASVSAKVVRGPAITRSHAATSPSPPASARSSLI